MKEGSERLFYNFAELALGCS